MAEGKKNAKRLGAYLIFIDESGFLLTPSVRKTWAPVGQTPLVRHHFRNQRISAISGISVSPCRRRLNLFWMLSQDNIRQLHVCQFLRQVLRHIRKPVIALLDNSPTHRGQPIRAICHRIKRFRVTYFPPYAPELNPDEGVWGALKGKLANGKPDNIAELEKELLRELRKINRSQRRLQGYIHQSDLPFLLP
jgi:transposase